MKSRLLGAVLCAFMLLVFYQSVYAAVIDLPDVAGVGYFQDSETGYIWMDVDNFLNMSFIEVSNALQGTGFQIADRAQVEEMHTSSGSNYASLAPIMGHSLWETASVPEQGTIWGTYSDLIDDGLVGYAFLWETRTTIWGYTDSGSSDTTPRTGMGAWVVETVVPIPAAVWLFGSGLIGLVGVARRRKQLH